MKTLTRLFFVLFFMNNFLHAQLKSVVEANMVSEAPIYQNEKGETYSTIVTFKYGTKLSDISQGVVEVKENQILSNDFKDFLKNIKRKFGNFYLSKAIPDAEWGDTLKINKRTNKIVKVTDLSQIYKINFTNPVPTDSVVDFISSFPGIVYAEGTIVAYLALTPNDPEYSGDYKWSFNAIKAEQAWGLTTGSSSVKVGIHDRFGVVYQVYELHEDLAGKVVWNNLNGIYGDHGINVAGVAGAMTNNSLGIASLGWNLNLMLSKWDYANIKTLVDNGADVINFSWVTTYDSPSLRDAISYALQNGVICIAAAGNDQTTVGTIPNVVYPAAYYFGTDAQVFAVSGTQLSNNVEQFIDGFNYSPGTNPISDPTNSFIDFAAPGTNYRACSQSDAHAYQHIWAGTSISSPFVSALVGLMLSVNNTLTTRQVYDILKSTADRIGQYTYDTNGWNRYLGYGRIDAWDAVNVAGGAPAETRNLHLTYADPNHPSLGWDINTESDISSYKVYRSYDNSSFYEAGTVTHPANTFVDNGIDYTKPIWEKSVKYYVVAVDNTSKTSVPSNQVETSGIMPLPPKINGGNYADEKMAEEVVHDFKLYDNYPDPFNPSTTIRYQIPESGMVTLKVYDILGKEVTTLVNGNKAAGYYEVNFDASKLTSGVYIYTISAGKYTESKKMILTK